MSFPLTFRIMHRVLPACVLVIAVCGCGRSREARRSADPGNGRIAMQVSYPDAVDPEMVGEYPALAGSGGGYVWDEVLEYRVWCHPEEGDDFYHPFATYAEAKAFADATKGAEEPLALIRQGEYIEEAEPGQYNHVREERITEWPVEFLRRPRRTADTIPDFLSPDAPPNRLEILRGTAAPQP